VSLNLTEFDVSRTRVGAVSRISADALGGRRYGGNVVDVGLSGGDTGGVVTFPVVISVDEASGLRPGMSVSVRIVVSRRPEVVRVPVDAVKTPEGGRATMTVRTPSGQLKKRSVKLGLVVDSFVEVRSGLSEGENVVVPMSGGG